MLWQEVGRLLVGEDTRWMVVVGRPGLDLSEARRQLEGLSTQVLGVEVNVMVDMVEPKDSHMQLTYYQRD